ncbi:hypothetical protein RUM43_006554 [Polyplax serrata]|uniref:Uncharacterized protein n=1 Tax=Polyplax serrata TaxID=468196 RepID=A0AAN8S5I8_POLSC
MHRHHNVTQKYSSRIAGSRYASHRPVFGIRTFPLGKLKSTDVITKAITTTVSPSTTENVLDFRIVQPEGNDLKAVNFEQSDDEDESDISINDEDEKSLDEDENDLRKASSGGKQKKEAEDEEEKTLAQQVADGKYGLIQNELFANGSKRPGIISYKSNSEVPRDTKENLGGLDKDEIWLAEDHILVLRGGNYQNDKENQPPGSPVWPPIDNYLAPKRQVKIPKNPEIPPPFPVQLSDDGPIEFIKGQNNPSFLPPVIPPLPSFVNNKSIPLPFTVVPIPSDDKNNSSPFPVPPQLLPPFLSNFPPGATFLPPPNGNNTEIDEDDPSIYYPPKYDFTYPLDNSTVVPPGPLVPGIILPPPPDFFSLLKPETPKEGHNESDDSINSVTSNVFVGPKYLPSLRKPGRTRLPGNVHIVRPFQSSSNTTKSSDTSDTDEKQKPPITYVYPENTNQKSRTPLPHNTFRTNNKAYQNKFHQNGFNSPIFVPNGPNRPLYHPLPTTSPKPNHITLPPTTKSLPKQILIITTPESAQKVKSESNHQKKPVETNKYEYLPPEIHPLRSLIKPNVTVSYNGKYGHLPPPINYQPVKPETDITIIRGHYVTQPPLTKGSKVPSTDANSITVTPVPVVKKVRIQQMPLDTPNVSAPPPNPTKATLYFYEETTTKEESPRNEETKQKSSDPVTEVPAIKPDDKPVTPYYYATHSTSKTPIRQFLEETFHSSNVLPRKPQIAHVNNAEIITHNGYADLPKMKHLNYATHVSSPRPVLKYHYITDGNTPVVIPTPKIQELEIKNSGSSGLQTVHLDPAPPVHSVAPPQPVAVEPYIEPKKPQEHQSNPISQLVTASPIEFNTADGPFVPSNYYATVRPDHVHFTSQEQTLVDDITKNYFTIFGQKINSASTTPLTPVKHTTGKTKPKQESGLSYISDDGRNYNIQQVHDTNGPNPSKSSSSFYTGEKAKPPAATRPPSNFEKYLKELTGEDQRDYIVSGVFPFKVKKGKGFLPNGIPAHLLPQHPVVFENDAAVTRPKVQYQPNLSTTLRPLAGAEIKTAYLQQIPSSVKPYDLYQNQVPQQNLQFNPNLQQYFQELTALTSPTTKRPIRVKKPNNEYLPKPPTLVPYQGQDVRTKPISLANDYLVNYKSPRPEVEPNAELLNIPYDNIKIVESPDLSRNPNQPSYGKEQIPFNIGKVIFQNLPKPEFFGPRQPHPNGGNAFVSYNLPGNGGHFFFLTPQQVVEKVDDEDARGRDKAYKRINRSQERSNRAGYTSSDYLRRRRKKP